MPTGYSGKPLAEKLGVREGMRMCVLGAPENYRSQLGILPPDVEYATSLGAGKWDLIHFFTQDADELTTLFPDLKSRLVPNGMLWISWPKQASGVQTDLKESKVMEIGLAGGLVDVKVTAIDETWSGLKFVHRVKDRK
jgi:hypothetical protein